MELRKKVIKGTVWTAGSQVGGQVLSFGVTIVLARLLKPEDFGIVALSYVFVNFAWLVDGLGLRTAIIQKQYISEEHLSTAFWASLFTGILISIILISISSFVAGFYKRDILKYIIVLFSVSFILSSFTSIHTTILTKKLEFKKIAFFSLTEQIINGVVAISLAVLGYGVWSLVLGGLVSRLFLIPIVWYIVNWRPQFVFSKKCFKDLFGFSSNVLGFSFVNYFARNSDNLIVGKVLGAQILGYYSIAYNLMMKPLQHISWSIGKVLFPALSSIQDDKERVRLAYLKVIRSISLITFPMMLGLLMVSREFILTSYGSKWEPAIIPLQLLCVLGAIQSIVTTVGTIFNSQGRPDLLLKTGILNSTIVVLAFLFGIKWGLIGLIIAYLVVSLPLYYISLFFANRLIDLKMKTFLKALYPATVNALLMVAVLFLFKYINNAYFHLNIILTLIISVILGITSYIIFTLILFKIPEVDELKNIIKQKLLILSPKFSKLFI